MSTTKLTDAMLKKVERPEKHFNNKGWQTFPAKGKGSRQGVAWTKPFKGDWNDDDNIAVVLGEKSRHLVDVDLDWPEAAIAARYLRGVCLRFWAGEGARHDAALAFAGVCKWPGISQNIVEALVQWVCDNDHDPETKDRLRAVADT